MRIEQSITHAWAYELKGSCTQEVIAELQTMKDEMLSGDSGLSNVWEEICAQVQGEQSFDWDSYEDVVETAVQGKVELLSREQQLAIWTLTDDGWNWVYDHFNDDDGENLAPMEMSAIVRLITDDVMSAASDFESKALYRFLWGADEEEDEDEEEEEEKDASPESPSVS